MYAPHIQKAIAASTVTADFDVAAFRSPGQSIVSPIRLKICSSNPAESEARVKNKNRETGVFSEGSNDLSVRITVAKEEKIETNKNPVARCLSWTMEMHSYGVITKHCFAF